MSAYSHKIYKSVEEINKSDWDQIVDQSSGYTFLSYDFLKVIEKTFESPTKIFYILIYKEAEVVACTTFSLFPLDAVIVATPFIKKMSASIRKRFSSFLMFKTMYCGIPISSAQKPILCPDKKHFSGALKYIDNLLIKTAKKEKALFNMYKEVPDGEATDFDLLIKNKYTIVESPPNYHWNFDFDSFDDYLKALKSRYRSNVKRAVKKFKKGGLKMIRTSDFKEISTLYTEEVHQLYLDVNAKSSSRIEVLPRAYFLALVEQYKEKAPFVFALDQDDKVVGFVSCLHSQDSFYCLFCGMDYSINEQYNIYYNIIYSSLQLGLERGARKIQIGQTSDEFKARLGCQKEPMSVYVRINKGILNYFFRKLSARLFVPFEAPSYDAFKAVASV